MKMNRQWLGGIAVLVVGFAMMLWLPVENSATSKSMVIARFAVERLSCGACSETIRDALLQIDGVAEVQVDVGRGVSQVRFDPRRTNAGQLAAAITAAGYPARALQGDGLPVRDSQGGSGGCAGGCCSGRKS